MLPDGYETAKATEILAKEGFTVLPYINPDIYVARACVDAGAAAVMPLGAPIGTNRGLRTKEMIGILIDELDLPIVVDAGIGRPSQACEAMELPGQHGHCLGRRPCTHGRRLWRGGQSRARGLAGRPRRGARPGRRGAGVLAADRLFAVMLRDRALQRCNTLAVAQAAAPCGGTSARYLRG